MAVIITNMNMPRSCYECRFSEPSYSGNRCDNMIGHKYSEILSERVKNCPLKEVPSGKWIPVTEIQNMRKEMSIISRVTDGERDILFTCLAMIDDLIEGYFEEQQGEQE